MLIRLPHIFCNVILSRSIRSLGRCGCTWRAATSRRNLRVREVSWIWLFDFTLSRVKHIYPHLRRLVIPGTTPDLRYRRTSSSSAADCSHVCARARACIPISRFIYAREPREYTFSVFYSQEPSFPLVAPPPTSLKSLSEMTVPTVPRMRAKPSAFFSVSLNRVLRIYDREHCESWISIVLEKILTTDGDRVTR